MPSRRSLPPVACWRGVSPSEAAKPRPLLNRRASPTVATTAVAITGPLPRRLGPPAGFVVTRLPDQPPVEISDPGLDRPQVLGLIDQELARQGRQPIVLQVRDDGEQIPQASPALRRDDPELRHVPSDRIDRARPLGDQPVPCR